MCVVLHECGIEVLSMVRLEDFFCDGADWTAVSDDVQNLTRTLLMIHPHGVANRM